MSNTDNTSNENNTNGIMNTVGVVVFENGILKFKRFGAAMKRKIKLGTAAFMNVVNNATTTEEGFVPDARVVAQQQTKITELQAQVQSLNSALQSAIPENVYVYSSNLLSSPGWYKFAESELVKQIPSSNISLFYIFRSYNNNAPECYLISFMETYNQAHAKIIDSFYSSRLLTKIRMVYDSEMDKTFYEIYYSGSKRNQVYIYSTFFPLGATGMDLVLDTGNPSVLFEYELN